MVAVVIVSASFEVKAAVSDLLARKMSEVLVAHPRGELDDEAACNTRLYAAGYSSTMIFHLGADARAIARAFFAARQIAAVDAASSIAGSPA